MWGAAGVVNLKPWLIFILRKLQFNSTWKKKCNSETKSSCLQYFRTSKYNTRVNKHLKKDHMPKICKQGRKDIKNTTPPNLYIFLFSGEEPGYEVILLPNMVWQSNFIPSFIYNASQKRNQIVAHVGLADHSTGEWRSDTVLCLTFRTLPICQQL